MPQGLFPSHQMIYLRKIFYDLTATVINRNVKFQLSHKCFTVSKSWPDLSSWRKKLNNLVVFPYSVDTAYMQMITFHSTNCALAKLPVFVDKVGRRLHWLNQATSCVFSTLAISKEICTVAKKMPVGKPEAKTTSP